VTGAVTGLANLFPLRYTRRMGYLTTTTVAVILGVTTRRVRALIKSGRLTATRAGRDWLIEPKSLDAVKVRTNGRPPKKLPKKSRKRT
jgi:excisionase family DNA binding protein